MSANKQPVLPNPSSYSDPIEIQRYMDRLRQIAEFKRLAELEQQRALQDPFRHYPNLGLPLHNTPYIPQYQNLPDYSNIINQSEYDSQRDNEKNLSAHPDHLNSTIPPQSDNFVSKAEFSTLQSSVNQLVELMTTQLSVQKPQSYSPYSQILPQYSNIPGLNQSPNNQYRIAPSPNPQNFASILSKTKQDPLFPLTDVLYQNPSLLNNPLPPAQQRYTKSRPSTTPPTNVQPPVTESNLPVEPPKPVTETKPTENTSENSNEDEQHISVFDETKYSDSHMEDLVAEFKTFHWKIQNWEMLEKRVVSETFECGGHNWRVLLRPFGSSHPEIVSLFLEYANAKEAPDGWHAIAQFVLSIANINEPSINTQGSAFHCFNKNDPNWGFTRFMKLSELTTSSFDEERPIVENGECVISAFVKVIKSPTGMPYNVKNVRTPSIREKKSPITNQQQ
ncbi:hypothetical protein BB559_000561 [Furculomyces boomerangus]|uniref:MATH domain-containing protein n=2 Tax=Harpellales TaxID=61421 RepID=A0A2T9Z4X4_9FUNG|nr:hypothetical protein BB559_000561 [Furculomyces boomerangus]PWA00964.1 hypothetical protein BB558_002979 [Smittium angustum]